MKIFVTILIGLFTLAPAARAESALEAEKLEKATFAGGCFWCMEHPFDVLEGVQSTIVGYTGGDTDDPTYKDISGGDTGHAEAVEIIFDPEKITYDTLLDIFWRNINPTTKNRQFADAGTQYRTAIFYHNKTQKKAAQSSLKKMNGSGRYDKAIVTEITPASKFYIAEEYHQDYYIKNPLRYKFYRYGSGRDKYLEKIWGVEKE